MKTTVVLWPTDLSTQQGVCYGWTKPLICVAGMVPISERLEAEVLLQSAIAQPAWNGLRAMFSSDPTILGYCTLDSANQPLRISFVAEVMHTDNLQFVRYRRHRRQSMRFYAFNFNELDILPSQEPEGTPSKLQRDTKVINDSISADFTRPPTPPQAKYSMVNLAHFLSDIVERERRSTKGTLAPSRPGTPDILLRRPHTPAVYGKREDIIHTTFSRTIQGIYTLSRMCSTTAEQFDVRYEQGAYVIGEVAHVYNDKARTVQSISKYIKFHNCVWLVLNDVIIGVAFGSFLCENERFFARYLHIGLQKYLVDGMQRALLWLNNWPAGLKLNTELSQFYCHSLVGVVSAWGWLLSHATPYFPALIWLTGAMGCCGMTMIISLLSDIFSLLTAHLYVCYYISATVFSHQLSLAGSLWNLFRGKRYNVLRNRIDTWDYDLDQLLLGTILFTLLAFLYPTVLTYYALFATARLATIVVHATFDTMTALLNHFPLFALLLRVKDPLRLPGEPPPISQGFGTC
ncbi:N-acetylglucosaminyl transferase component-domain-containing protein [Fomes fomentarius]|nr:N-acetylglucosaminyl transferase component-domain-containing protein [Fomes fomentarius]